MAVERRPAVILGALLALTARDGSAWARSAALRVSLPDSVFLNCWAAEAGRPLLEPAEYLKPSTDYNVVLDISWGPYELPGLPERRSVHARFEAAHVGAWVEAALEAPAGVKAVPLSALFFSEEPMLVGAAGPGARVKRLEIDADRLRRLAKEGPPPPGPVPPANHLPEGRFSALHPDAVLGRVVFKARTGSEPGEAPFGIAIKRQGEVLGVLSARFCITSDDQPFRCRGRGLPRPSEHFEGVLRGRHDETGSDLLWNLWAERPDDPGTPLPTLEPQAAYRLTLDLAAISYAGDGRGVYARGVGQALQARIGTWTEPWIDLDVLLVGDPRSFELPRHGLQRLRVDLQKLRSFRSKGEPFEGDPLLAIAGGALPDFAFGRVAFDVKTRARPGLGSLALSLWHRGRPVDEVVVPMCVAEKGAPPRDRCGEGRTGSAWEGVDSLRLARESGPAPDAAVHLVDLGREAGVVGIFRTNHAGGQPVVWPFEADLQQFRSQLSDTYLKPLGQAIADDALRNRGRSLFEFLFPAPEARQAFLDFVAPKLRRPPEELPSLFFRMIQSGPNPPLLIPLGLLAMPVDGQDRFLGFSFRIESPLESQTYQAPSGCVARWVTALPPENVDEALTSARAALGADLGDWSSKKDPASPFHSMRELGQWLGQGEEAQSLALVVLSHHASDKLYFYDDALQRDDPLTPSRLRRRFRQPSLAVLAGCGTAGPGADGIVRQLNKQEIMTVIGASTEVGGSLAGAFLSTFADEVRKQQGARGLTVSHAFLATARRVSQMKPPGPNAGTYGAGVLKFSLMGNGSVRVCPPAPASPP